MGGERGLILWKEILFIQLLAMVDGLRGKGMGGKNNLWGKGFTTMDEVVRQAFGMIPTIGWMEKLCLHRNTLMGHIFLDKWV